MIVDKSKWQKTTLEKLCKSGASDIVISKTEIGIGKYKLYGASGFVGNVDFYHNEEPYLGLVKDGSGVGRIDKYPAKSSLVGTMQYLFPTDLANIDFLKYLIEFLNLAKYVKGAAIPHIYYRHYKNEKVTIPNLAIQSQIASELDAIQTMIEGYKAQLIDLDELIKSIFNNNFGEPISNPKGWDVDTLENIVSEDCPITYGIVQPGDEVEEGVPVVRPVDLTETYVKKEHLKRVLPEISDSYKRTILKGDEILICVRGTTGIVSFASEDLKDCNVTRGIVPLSFDKHNKWFMYWCIKSFEMNNLIQKYTKGATLKQINIKDLRQLPFPIPPIELQEEFGKQAELIEKQKNLIKEQLSDAKELMAERMQYYFS